MDPQQPARPTVDRRRRRRAPIVAIALAVATALVTSACGSTAAETNGSGNPTTSGTAADGSAKPAPTEITPIKFGIPWVGAAGTTPTDTGPVGYAHSLGKAAPILARHGFELTETVAFNNGPPAVEALQADSVQIVQVGDTPAVAARASGKDNRALVVNEPALDAWFISREGGPSKVADFGGKKVGLQFGSNFDKYGRAVLDEAGVLDQVELVNLPFADALPALQRGDIDGYAIIGNLGAIWLKSNPGFQVLEKASEGDGSLLGTSVVLVTPAFLEAHPGVQDAWWAVYEAGVAEIEKDPDAYYAWVSETNGTPVDVVEQTSLLNFADEPISTKGLTALEGGLAFLVEIGTAKETFDIDAWTVTG
jgi:NitT/TauT family transport system substrate-binding protein/sulfonate transport system substrate-binding protein